MSKTKKDMKKSGKEITPPGSKKPEAMGKEKKKAKKSCEY